MKSASTLPVVMLTALVALSAAAPATPQNPPPAQPQDPESTQAVIRRRVDLVVVPVTVRDSQGRAVYDLRREEFRIFEDGEEQEIVLFSAEAFPLSVIILIDNDMPRSVAEDVEQSVAAIAAGLGPEDEATVMLFDVVPSTPEELTKDNDLLFNRLKRIRLNETFPGMGSAPMTAGPRVNQQPQSTGVPKLSGREAARNKNLHDAVWAAAQLLRGAARERRKMIFLISDGRNSRNNQFSFEQTAQLLLASDISVYSISLDRRAVKTGGDLARYASATGGDVYLARSRESLASLYTRIPEQARNQYTLAYAPRRGAGGEEFHEIEVRVRRPGLTLLARQGYFNAVP